MPEQDNDAERVLKMMIKPYVEAAYAQGRADERADVVAWLRKRDREYVVADYCAGDIKRGEHVDAAKGKP